MSKQLWTEEYNRKGIPSSHKSKPSKSVEWFLEFLKFTEKKGKVAADLGYGTGRNSKLLKSHGYYVIAMDIIDAKQAEYGIKYVEQDTSEKWPANRGYFDVAIDVFSYIHLATKEKQAEYRKQLNRTLKPGGFYLLAVPGTGDGYYSKFPLKSGDQHVDPIAGVTVFLYDETEVQDEFHNLNLVAINEVRKSGYMHNEIYDRETLWCIFQKPHIERS